MALLQGEVRQWRLPLQCPSERPAHHLPNGLLMVVRGQRSPVSWLLMPRTMPIRADLAIPIAASLALCCSACTKSNAPFSRQDAQSRAQESRYLTDRTMPNILSLIPPPPASGTPAMARDEAARRAALSLHGTPRYALAAA